VSEPITFDDRVAIVTGAGGGLGKTYALELARRGARVVVNDLGGAVDGTGSSESAADKVVTEIAEAGGEAVANYDSVASPEGGESIVQTALDSFGKVDIVINNAGILRDKSFTKMTMDEVQAVLDVHLKGGFNVSSPAFKVMRENAYGRFVFTSSASGLFGNFGQANYGAAKAGLVGLTNVLAIEGAKYNIKANAIAPIAKTRMTEDLPIPDAVAAEHVTPMVVYLCSEANQYTHEIFTAGGGRYGRVFIGTNRGWFSGAERVATAEDVAEHIDDIRDLEDYIVPMSNNDEIMILGEMLSS
jgi:NAD(P)-dependent dehydrogenase (short-subunit alcohol dehydrogenase family)